MAGISAVFAFLFLGSSIIVQYSSQELRVSGFSDEFDRLHALKSSFLSRNPKGGISPGAAVAPPISSNSRVFYATSYGADPTGNTDSTDTLLQAISDAFQAQNNRVLMPGIPDLGGAQVHLQGGSYKISRPLRLPSSGGGNVMIHGGSLCATEDFPKDRHLIELWPVNTPKLDSEDKAENAYWGEKTLYSTLSYEDITLKDLMLDSNFRGGGVSVINSLRTTIDNCYVSHFTTDGIFVQAGHETYIRNSFIGQHITAGGNKNEKNFSGVGINLMSNDNAVTDVVIFSAATGILVSGQANTLTGVHCYNKANGWGGIGIHLRLPGLTQIRILNCYLDYNGIVAEDPVQLHISNSFFLGNAFILLKAVKGVVQGLNIVDNMFSGDGTGVSIIQLDQSKARFTTIGQVVVDRNNGRGMTVRSTVARGSVVGNGRVWAIDFSRTLLFPNLIKHVQYSLNTGSSFPKHVLRNVSNNRVVVESDVPLNATVYVWVDQSLTAVS